jgi:hypothetical protein
LLDHDRREAGRLGTLARNGEQRIYASHKSIMFSRTACYFFVRPKKKVLEIWFFLGRTLKHPLIHKSVSTSKLKVGHLVHVTHRLAAGSL